MNNRAGVTALITVYLFALNITVFASTNDTIAPSLTESVQVLWKKCELDSKTYSDQLAKIKALTESEFDRGSDHPPSPMAHELAEALWPYFFVGESNQLMDAFCAFQLEDLQAQIKSQKPRVLIEQTFETWKSCLVVNYRDEPSDVMKNLVQCYPKLISKLK